MANEFHHITPEERKTAQDLWNNFNAELKDRGMQLMYDEGGGGFIVVSTELGEAENSLGDNVLTEAELVQVIAEGSFVYDETVNNPIVFIGIGGGLAVRAE
jgi:hypothetical protein